MAIKRRRSYFINPPFQTKMILASFAITIPLIGLFYWAYSHFVSLFVEKIETIDQNSATILIGFFSEIEYKLKLVIMLGTLVLLIFNFVVFLVLSHAIAGPIEKLKNHLRKKAQNEVTGPFVVRSTDFFSELPEFVNEVFRDSPKNASSNVDSTPEKN